MTRKDYELIARQVAKVRLNTYMDENHARADAQLLATAEVAANLARALQQDNPRFDAVKFLLACGIARDDIHVTLA